MSLIKMAGERYESPLRLGKRAVQRDPRNFKFSAYRKSLRHDLPLAPATESYILRPTHWPMMLNDQLGDCVIAAMGHMIQQWTYYATNGTAPVVLSNGDILKGYEDVGGYVPGDPFTDNGCDMLSALKYWRKHGLAGHKILAFMQVDPTNIEEVQAAVWLFGNLFTGLALPLSAQNTVDPYKWTVPTYGPIQDGSPWSWGGHCVPIMGSSAHMHPLITWGQRWTMTRNFMDAYCDELYAVVAPEWVSATNGIAPNGFDLSTLLADLAQI